MKHFQRLKIASAIALSLGAAPLHANDSLPEIVVTADFRDSELLDTAASVSVLQQETIRQRGAQHLEDVINTVPNLNFAGGTSRARYFQVRGIGDRSQFQEPLNPSVGVLVDGVDFSGLGSNSTLFDIEQVEILRGPQGTLHGANALAGLINIRSQAPTEDFHHRLEATVGDYDALGLGAISSGPLSESLLYRLAVQHYEDDGYQENDFLGVDDTAKRDELTLRGRLRWLASDTHTLDITLNMVDIDNGYDAFSLDNTRTTLSDQPGRDTQESLSLGVTSTLDTARVRIESSLSIADSDSEYGYDEDWTFEGFHPDGYSSFDLYQRSRDSVSAQVRLVSKESARLFGDRSDWVAGLYYLGNREDLDREYTYAPFFSSEYDTDTLAVFGQVDTRLGDHWTLVTGLRFEQRKTEYSDINGVDFNPDENLWGGRLALEYRFDDGALAYGAISRGYRANGVNAGILSSLESTDDPDVSAALKRVTTFDEETLVNYELGLKHSLLEDSLRLRAALFYMDRGDQQVRGSFLVPRESGATTFIDYTSNAAEGENLGAELELDWLATERLHLWANLGLLDTEFRDYVNIFGEDLSGRAQAQAPEYQFALGGRYLLTDRLYLRLELEGKDGFYFSDRHDARADSYELINATLGYDTERWSLRLWGRNLGDEDIRVRGFGSFGNDPRKGYITEPYYQCGEPRMFGVTASVAF